MSPRSWTAVGFLAALWGASYLFIKLGLEDLSPAMVVFLRTALAALVLVPLALRRGAFAGLRSRMGAVLFVAAVQVAAPFLLISIGEEHISSSLAGIIVACAPIFTVLLVLSLDGRDGATTWSFIGIATGIVGVALLLGVDVGGDGAALVGALLVVLASLGYAVGAIFLKRKLSDLQPVGVVTATMAASAVLVLPLAALTAPSEVPGAQALGAMAALGIAGTGIAFYIFYTLIANIGPAKASLVAYIAPVFAVLYGVTLLGESVGVGTFAGLVLILAGSWLAAEGRRPGGARQAAHAPPRPLRESAVREAA